MKPIKKPNARLGVKRGPYKCKGKKKLAEAANAAAAQAKKEDGFGFLGDAAAKPGAKANGLLGKRNAKKQGD